MAYSPLNLRCALSPTAEFFLLPLYSDLTLYVAKIPFSHTHEILVPFLIFEERVISIELYL